MKKITVDNENFGYELQVLEEEKQIHILDLNKMTKSVTNGIEEIQNSLVASNEITKIDDYKWILYGTDGVVTEFNRKKEPKFEKVKEATTLLEEYEEEMEKRR